jgi:thymidylate kinase
VTVSFSGVDGAGKSTQAARLVETLNRAGVPATAVWARIGYSGSRLLTAVVTAVQRILPARHHSAQRQRAAGTATPGTPPLTRRGIVGWSWALASTLEYLRILRLEARRSSARVIVFDRGLPDALVGLEEEFGGAVRLELHRRLIRRWGPRADVMFYLRLSGHAAHGRKDDSFAADVLEAHARRYEELLARMPGAVVVLDAERPPAELAHEALRRLAARPG